MKTGRFKALPVYCLGLMSLLAPGVGLGEEVVDPATAHTNFMVGNLWLLVSACLVFVMHLGFACLEAGFVQLKNTANILCKNVCIIALGILTYALMGFNLMYPGEFNGVLGFAGFGIAPGVDGLTSAYNPAYTYWTDFIFQAMFAATAATIVSGAIAERAKLDAFLIFTTVFLAVFYPIIGSWKWGGGFLDQMATPFYDFAGSTLVHCVGGCAALAGAIVLGPRLGKYVDGKIHPIHPHSMPLGNLGVFLLWFGWYGFNGGSVLSADPAAVSLVFVTTTIAAAAGIIGALVASVVSMKRIDLAMALNGALGGLVGITAGADQMAPLSAFFIGLIAGAIVVFSILTFDRIKVDDPVGAISVHMVCGIWGTLAVGLFGQLASGAQLMSQVIGILACASTAFVASFAIFFVLKKTIGFRVTEEDERVGLDQSEHGVSAYRGMATVVDVDREEHSRHPDSGVKSAS